jgi:pimeloyl-ACP methyl ester carboxylesterase
MLHGFGGTALTFIRTFQHLKEHYQVHALDTFGVGLSSIGNYSEKFTQEEARNYFVDAVEEWRKTVGLKTFTLVGHSFGGYIAASYCEKYPGHVRRLVLLSPAGTTEKSKE